MEFNVVKPLKPKLYRRYFDDIYSTRIKINHINFSRNEAIIPYYKVDNRIKFTFDNVNFVLRKRSVFFNKW